MATSFNQESNLLADCNRRVRGLYFAYAICYSPRRRPVRVSRGTRLRGGISRELIMHHTFFSGIQRRRTETYLWGYIGGDHPHHHSCPPERLGAFDATAPLQHISDALNSLRVQILHSPGPRRCDGTRGGGLPGHGWFSHGSA